MLFNREDIMFEVNFNKQETENTPKTKAPKQNRRSYFLYFIFALCLLVFCYQFLLKNVTSSKKTKQNEQHNHATMLSNNNNCYFKRNKVSELKLVGVIISKNKSFAFIKNTNGTTLKLTLKDKLGTYCESIKNITLDGIYLNTVELLFS